MHYLVKGCVLASLLLTGCSLFKTEKSTVAEQVRSELKIPSELHQPNRPGRYDIPDTVVNETVSQGQRAPALILTTATSSRLDETETLARVWFERNDYTGELVPFIQHNIKRFFETSDIGLEQQDNDGLLFETDWVTRYNEEGFWLFKEQIAREQARFRLQLEPRVHGRSTSLTVTMLEHRYFTEHAELSESTKKQEEITLLNQLINQVAVAETEVAREIRTRQIETTLVVGTALDGETAFVTAQPIDVTWSQLEVLFPELNFQVTDINRSVFTYYLKYSKPKPGFFARLWGNEKPGLPIEEGEYQVILSRHIEGTAISFRDQNGDVLAADTIEKLYEPVINAVQAASIEL